MRARHGSVDDPDDSRASARFHSSHLHSRRVAMRIQRLILALILALSFTVGTVPVDAGSGSKGSGHATKGASKPKTVHVKEYARKDGTRVKAHDRAALKSKGRTAETWKR